MAQDDAAVKDVLRRTRTIACIGFSANPSRPSHYVSQYLVAHGYRVIPVNPGLAGKSFLGEVAVGSLAEAPPETDMIDVFRRPEHVLAVVEEAVEALPHLATVWLQLGIRSEAAAEVARARGITVIQDRCTKMDHQRLF